MKRFNLQKVPFLQNVHEVREVQWVQAGQSYHPYQEIQKNQWGPGNNIKRDFNLTFPPHSLRH